MPLVGDDLRPVGFQQRVVEGNRSNPPRLVRISILLNEAVLLLNLYRKARTASKLYREASPKCYRVRVFRSVISPLRIKDGGCYTRDRTLNRVQKPTCSFVRSLPGQELLVCEGKQHDYIHDFRAVRIIIIFSGFPRPNKLFTAYPQIVAGSLVEKLATFLGAQVPYVSICVRCLLHSGLHYPVCRAKTLYLYKQISET